MYCCGKLPAVLSLYFPVEPLHFLQYTFKVLEHSAMHINNWPVSLLPLWWVSSSKACCRGQATSLQGKGRGSREGSLRHQWSWIFLENLKKMSRTTEIELEMVKKKKNHLERSLWTGRGVQAVVWESPEVSCSCRTLTGSRMLWFPPDAEHTPYSPTHQSPGRHPACPGCTGLVCSGFGQACP